MLKVLKNPLEFLIKSHNIAEILLKLTLASFSDLFHSANAFDFSWHCLKANTKFTEKEWKQTPFLLFSMFPLFLPCCNVAVSYCELYTNHVPGHRRLVICIRWNLYIFILHQMYWLQDEYIYLCKKRFGSNNILIYIIILILYLHNTPMWVTQIQIQT